MKQSSNKFVFNKRLFPLFQRPPWRPSGATAPHTWRTWRTPCARLWPPPPAPGLRVVVACCSRKDSFARTWHLSREDRSPPGLPVPRGAAAPSRAREGGGQPALAEAGGKVARQASAASHTLHAAQGYTTHRKLGGRFGRRGRAPTTLWVLAPPDPASRTPPMHTSAAPTPACTPGSPRGTFGRVLGGPIFRTSPSVYRGRCFGSVL